MVRLGVVDPQRRRAEFAATEMGRVGLLDAISHPLRPDSPTAARRA
jgi:hypothetical protein